MTSVSAVMYEASSEARNATAAAMSCTRTTTSESTLQKLLKPILQKLGAFPAKTNRAMSAVSYMWRAEPPQQRHVFVGTPGLL